MHYPLLAYLFTFSNAAIDARKYPPPYLPPSQNPEWNRIFLSDFKDSDIPVREVKLEQPDWKKDVFECNSKDEWALTIDDGCSVFTSNITAEFARVNSKGTFFVVGSQILTFDQELKDLAAAGHQIGIHTWSHTA